MTTINPAMVPTKAPGTLFSALTGDDPTLNIRWLTALDPVFYEVFNRPLSDTILRQLVIAKAVDNLQLRLGHDALFPFIVQPLVASGTTEVDLPIGLIWDFHASMPKKWENLRLAKVKRISGTNGTEGYTGKLRLIFTANIENSVTEVALFQSDFIIDSTLTYQLNRLTVVSSAEESVVINPGETETIAGFIIFRTMDLTLSSTQDFLDLVAPPTDTNDSDSDGEYDNPAIYEIVDSVAGGTAVTDDYSSVAISHGTGLMTDSAWNAIPQLDSDIQTWITSFNYPFDAGANRISTTGITIPNGLFREFDIAAPAGDQPTGDSSGTFYPVWINRIERIGTGSNQLRFFFATYNVTDTESDGTPSTNPIEFASLDLIRSYLDGRIIEITPIENLQLQSGLTEFQQGFGRGHVVLSSIWDGTSTIVADFFDSFDLIATTPPDTEFTLASTRISSFGLSRIPKYIPTIGQSQALVGSTERFTVPLPPSFDNRYVCEDDQGLGNQIDLEAQAGITPAVGIDRYGYSGALNHRIIKLVTDSEQVGSDNNFYETEVLPRLRILLGRDPQFGDFWFNGTRLFFFNGDTWQG